MVKNRVHLASRLACVRIHPLSVCNSYGVISYRAEISRQFTWFIILQIHLRFCGRVEWLSDSETWYIHVAVLTVECAEVCCQMASS